MVHPLGVSMYITNDCNNSDVSSSESVVTDQDDLIDLIIKPFETYSSGTQV